MRNVTIALDDEIARKARVRAAELDMSLSKYLAKLLEKEFAHADEYEHSRRAFRDVPRGAISDPNVPYPHRDELYDRPVLR